MEQTSIPKWQIVAGWVFSGILSFLFLPTGFLDEWTKTYPASSALPLGVIEVTIFALYLVPKTRYLGGLLMLAYLGGAVATHLHAGDDYWIALKMHAFARRTVLEPYAILHLLAAGHSEPACRRH